MDKLLKAVELARVLGVNRGMIYKWIKSGMPVLRVPGLSPRFQIERVKEWLSQFESSEYPVKTVAIPQESGLSIPKGDGVQLPRGVFLPPHSTIYMIAYQIPGPEGTSKRVRESSGVRDPQAAAAIRLDRLHAAWKDAPPGVLRDRYMNET